MFSFTKYPIIAIQIILCCSLLFSCNKEVETSKTVKEYQSLEELKESSQSERSFEDKVAKIREETELIDDRTERMLNRHKRWFVLGGVLFLWLAFQSLVNYRRD